MNRLHPFGLRSITSCLFAVALVLLLQIAAADSSASETAKNVNKNVDSQTDGNCKSSGLFGKMFGSKSKDCTPEKVAQPEQASMYVFLYTYHFNHAKK
jgi:hypothetical protein